MELLQKRLKILNKFIKVSEFSNEYKYYKHCLVQNQISLIKNAKRNSLNLIDFDETCCNTLNHIAFINVVYKNMLLNQ
jgi:hypothetical protein